MSRVGCGRTRSSGEHRGYGGAVFFRPGDLVFVDESKARGYFLVATATSRASARTAGRQLRTLLKPGQRRLHFKGESDSRRRFILSKMVTLEVDVAVWEVRNLPDKDARPLCLEAMVAQAARCQVGELVIESDASLETADRRMIAAVSRAESGTFAYRHCPPHEEPLLWISDAVAWCYSKGGDWRRRVASLVDDRSVRLEKRVSLARRTVRKTARL